MPVNKKKAKMMFLLVLLLFFLPDSIFPYEEYKQPMSDFPIKDLVLTKDYIYCASNGLIWCQVNYLILVVGGELKVFVPGKLCSLSTFDRVFTFARPALFFSKEVDKRR